MLRSSLFAIASFIAIALTAAAANSPSFKPGKLAAIDAAVAAAINARKLPGGVLWLERDGQVYRKAYGHRALVPIAEPATEDTLYDAASLTKVVATTTAVMQLVERGKLDLDTTVAHYLPAFAAHGKETQAGVVRDRHRGPDGRR
jgi:CubicO group peptidase (beta-lactamase class C family)